MMLGLDNHLRRALEECELTNALPFLLDRDEIASKLLVKTQGQGMKFMSYGCPHKLWVSCVRVHAPLYGLRLCACDLPEVVKDKNLSRLHGLTLQGSAKGTVCTSFVSGRIFDVFRTSVFIGHIKHVFTGSVDKLSFIQTCRGLAMHPLSKLWHQSVCHHFSG